MTARPKLTPRLSAPGAASPANRPDPLYQTERNRIMPTRTPQSIPELWYALDKRLALMEETQRSHDQVHAALNKCLDDHETRLRSSGVGALLAASVTSFLSVLAMLKAFLK